MMSQPFGFLAHARRAVLVAVVGLVVFAGIPATAGRPEPPDPPGVETVFFLKVIDKAKSGKDSLAAKGLHPEFDLLAHGLSMTLPDGRSIEVPVGEWYVKGDSFRCNSVLAGGARIKCKFGGAGYGKRLYKIQPGYPTFKVKIKSLDFGELPEEALTLTLGSGDLEFEKTRGCEVKARKKRTSYRYP